MASSFVYVLLAEMLIFSLVAIRCGWMFITGTYVYSILSCFSGFRGRHGERVLAEAGVAETDSAGTDARRRVQTMLGIACLARAATMAFVIQRGAWGPYLVVPDLAFMCTYSQLVLFLVHTQHSAVGLGYRSIRPQVVAAIVLGVILVISLVACWERWIADSGSFVSLLLWKILCYELGVTYLFICAAFTYNGIRVVCAARLHRATFSRMIILTAVCGCALLAKAATFIVGAAHASNTSEPFPSLSSRYRFEALVALEELLPSLMILVLTEKGRPRVLDLAHSETAALASFANSGASMTSGQAQGGEGGYGSAMSLA